MKRIVYILCAAAALLTAFTGCQKQADQGTMQTVDLRYRANDSYDLPATDAPSFVIMVASSEAWEITSKHPDWCIISQEEGEGAPADSVKIGHAPITSVRVQYYDNTYLDDRTDTLIISSSYWVGKRITVNQKGIAFLTVADEDLDQSVIKAGGDYTIHVNSNQDWSAKVTDGDWMFIADGATGTKVGTVTVTATENSSELRYADVTIYDRHDVPMYIAKFTQDGVQLVPATTEIRASYDQASSDLEIISNTKWTVAKASEADDWFSLDKTSGEGNDVVHITFVQNDDPAVRKADIVIKNVVEQEGDYQAEKTVVIKQGYKIEPVRVLMNNDELSLWKSDWANTPTYIKDSGLYFLGKARLNRSMTFGTYTFRWSALTTDPELGGPRVRHWFCFGESAELKADIRPADGKISFDFNAAGDGNKPSLDGYTDVDFTQPVEFTYKFDRNGKTGVFNKDGADMDVEYCHVTYLVNGVEVRSFDTASDLMRSVYFGASINMYIGVDVAGSAICEWYEYTAPMNWDE